MDYKDNILVRLDLACEAAYNTAMASYHALKQYAVYESYAEISNSFAYEADEVAEDKSKQKVDWKAKATAFIKACIQAIKKFFMNVKNGVPIYTVKYKKMQKELSAITANPPTTTADFDNQTSIAVKIVNSKAMSLIVNDEEGKDLKSNIVSIETIKLSNGDVSNLKTLVGYCGTALKVLKEIPDTDTELKTLLKEAEKSLADNDDDATKNKIKLINSKRTALNFVHAAINSLFSITSSYISRIHTAGNHDDKYDNARSKFDKDGSVDKYNKRMGKVDNSITKSNKGQGKRDRANAKSNAKRDVRVYNKLDKKK